MTKFHLSVPELSLSGGQPDNYILLLIKADNLVHTVEAQIFKRRVRFISF